MKNEIDGYIQDIYDLARSDFSRESMNEASRIIDYLIPVVVVWRMRKMDYALCFFGGIVFTVLAAKLYAMCAL